MDLENDLQHRVSPAVTDMGGSLKSSDVNSMQKQKQGQGVEHKGPPDFSLDDSDAAAAAIKDPLHESADLPSSERIAQVKTKKNRKRKRMKTTKHNVAKSNFNDCCGTPENTSTSKASTSTSDMPSEKSNGECDIQGEGGNGNSIAANAELFAKESVLEVNMEQSVNDDNSSNPEEKSGSVKHGSPVVQKQHDDYLAVNDFSDKLKTYARRKVLNSNYGRNPVNCSKEPTMQDNHKDDDSDGQSTDGLMERETEHSRDQATSHTEVAAEEMELMTEEDTPVMQPEETTSARQLEEHAEITRNDLCYPGGVSDISLVSANDGNSKVSQFTPERTIVSNSKNKLLILDVNGLLADCVSFVPSGYHQPEPDFWLRRRKVYKRPFCDDFLQFCFDRFHVGVWSSRAKCNVDEVIKFLMGESASKLLFCWNQSHCTTTNFSTVENRDKPLVLKELRKIWEKVDPGLPWEKGEFNESNTLLLDDSPYKALVNPMHTAIFPYSYRYYHTKDSSLGPGGDLRVYLEGLAMAENVQEYVSLNPFGQRPIREANPSWGYYCKVIEAVKARKKR